MTWRPALLLATACVVAAEAEWEDSPTLTSIWQATSSGESERLIDIFVTAKDAVHARASDGRGPLFWAYEFKNSEALALLLHLGVEEDTEDAGGKKPSEFFPAGPEEVKEFAADAESKIEELAALFKEREEELAAEPDLMDAYDDGVYEEAHGSSEGTGVDEIDYADDEDEEDEVEEPTPEQKQRLEALKQKAQEQSRDEL